MSAAYRCSAPSTAARPSSKSRHRASTPTMHALWINPADSNHHLIGGDGGLNVSYDRGGKWEHFKNLPISQFYGVSVDMRKPYRVYGGLQDNGSWGGVEPDEEPRGHHAMPTGSRSSAPTASRSPPIPNDIDTVYAEWQYGRFRRVTISTHQGEGHHAEAGQGRAAVSLQLEHAPPAVAARLEDGVLRRQSPVPIQEPRRHLGSRQPRPDARPSRDSARIPAIR